MILLDFQSVQQLESLIELLDGAKKTKWSSATCAEGIEATLAACWRPMLVARSLWRELGLESILDGVPKTTNVVQLRYQRASLDTSADFSL